MIGSGSTYIYGHVDAAFKPGFTKEECQAFVKKCKWHIPTPTNTHNAMLRTQ
jgi:hypothetical protein